MPPIVDLQQRRWKRYEQVLLDKLTAFGRQVCSEATLSHALEQFWGKKGLSAPEFDDEVSFARFFDWFLFDYRRTSRARRVIERFRGACWEELSQEERQLLEAWEDSSLGVYEVLSVRPGESLVLADVFTGERLEARDHEAAARLHKYDLVLTRPLRVFETYSLSAASLVVPRSWKPAVEKLVREEYARYGRRHPGAGWKEFFRARAHRLNRLLVDLFLDRPRPRLQTASGEDLILCRAWFDVTDPEGAAAVLAAAPGLHPAADAGDGSAAWHWFRPEEGGGLVLGEVRLRGSRLRLQCLARERLEAGKRFLAELLGDRLRHRLDEYRNPEELMHGRLAAGGPLPEDVAAAIRQFLYNYYRRWIDAPVPALGGRSPRQACATEEGRLQVTEILKHLENLEEKKKRAGQPYIEVNVIRRELGLPEED